MLSELYIKNYALIEELTLQFSSKLTVLSGETGAGKSIIVGALGLILGEKARTSQIRTGADSCIVEGRFEIAHSHPVYAVLEEKGIDCNEGDAFVIRRIITRTGSSRSFINGLQVTVRDLHDMTALLVDIHGQHEHQSLLTVRNHLHLLDQYGRLQDDLAEYQQSYGNVIYLQEEIQKRTIDEREKERKIDILSYSITEINRANIATGEEEDLKKEYKVLRNYESLVSSISGSYEPLKGDEFSALTLIEQALSALGKVREVSYEIDGIVDNLENARVLVDESASDLKKYIDGIEYEPGKIDGILSRLELIKNIKKKYGETVSEIQQYRQRCEKELATLETNDAVIQELENRLEKELKQAQKLAIELSVRRRVAAKTLSEAVMEEFKFLSLAKARFSVHIHYTESENGPVVIDGKRYKLSTYGLDNVEFLISTNVGEPLMPLKNVASGGELSRIMLAIKTVLGNIDPIQTFVFDEIDAGIGGKVAWAVGNRLRTMAALKQIICITHQAQIASRGNLNIQTEKRDINGRTVTEVNVLKDDRRVEEIARMISGKTISSAAIEQARQMLEENA